MIDDECINYVNDRDLSSPNVTYLYELFFSKVIDNLYLNDDNIQNVSNDQHVSL